MRYTLLAVSGGGCAICAPFLAPVLPFAAVALFLYGLLALILSYARYHQNPL